MTVNGSSNQTMNVTAERFPDDVIVLMHDANVTVSCVPVQIDNDEWQAAIFLVIPAAAPCLDNGKLQGGPFAVEFSADLHEHEKATVIELGIEVHTPREPSYATLLFITGHSQSHFESLKMLCEQEQLRLFIGDEYCSLLMQQAVPLSSALRSGLRQLLDEAVGRDAVIRMTGHYDPEIAFSEVVAELRLH